MYIPNGLCFTLRRILNYDYETFVKASINYYGTVIKRKSTMWNGYITLPSHMLNFDQRATQEDLASYPGLRREGLVHTIVRMSVNLTNFRLKPEIPLFLRVTITFEFHKPQVTSTTMARFSCLCFSDCVSYTLRKLQMTTIFLRVKQHYSMEAVYNSHVVFVWLPTSYGKSLCDQAIPLILDFKL